jgi:hypothetical protein
MKCEVKNRSGERSTRYVEHAVFPLWKYLMQNRHGLKVRRATPCVWVPHDEWRKTDRVMGRAGPNERVARLSFAAHDEKTGVTERSVRFVPDSDYDQVSALLVPRLGSDEFDLEAGAAIAAA